MILERRTHKVIGKVEDLVAMEKKFDELEAKMQNVPPKRRYWSGFGTLPSFMFVWEREWESMAALEAYQKCTMTDPEWGSLFEETSGMFGDIWSELYFSFE